MATDHKQSQSQGKPGNPNLATDSELAVEEGVKGANNPGTSGTTNNAGSDGRKATSEDVRKK